MIIKIKSESTTEQFKNAVGMEIAVAFQSPHCYGRLWMTEAGWDACRQNEHGLCGNDDGECGCSCHDDCGKCGHARSAHSDKGYYRCFDNDPIVGRCHCRGFKEA